MIGKTTKKLWARRLLPLAIVALALWALSLFPPVAAGLRVARVFFGNNTSRATWHSTENSAVIPFEFDRVISLPVQVNDGPVLRFALDTGSPIVALIGGAHVDALDLKIGGSLPISGAGSGATPTAYAVNGLNLKVGPLELHNQSVALIPWREMSMMFSSAEHVFIHGIVGYDLLRRYIVTIDFEREEIILHRPDEFEYNGSGVTVPMTFSPRYPFS